MATVISEALDALLSCRESSTGQLRALDQLLGLVADLLAGKEPGQVKAWREAQESFDGNVACVVLSLVGRSMAQLEQRHGELDALTTVRLTKALSLLQGLLFLHPRSARLFERKGNLEALLAVLKLRSATPSTSPLVSSPTFDAAAAAVNAHNNLMVHALSTISAAIVDRPRSARIFEEVGGLADLADLLRSKDTSQEIRYACLEILFVYLGPEEQAAAGGLARTPSTAAALSKLTDQRADVRSRPLSKTASQDSFQRPVSAHSPSIVEPILRPTTPTTPVNPFLPPPTPARSRSSVAFPRQATPTDERLRKMLEQADTSWTPSSPRKARAGSSGVETPLMRSKKRPPSLVLDSPVPIFSQPVEQERAGLRSSMSFSSSAGPRNSSGGHHRRQSSAAPRQSGFMPSIPSMPTLASPPTRSPLAPTTSAPAQSPVTGLTRSRSSYGMGGPPARNSSFDPVVTAKPSLSPSRSRRSLAASTPPASPSKRLSSLVQQAQREQREQQQVIRPDPMPLVSRHSSSSSSTSSPTEGLSRRASVGKAASPLKRVSSSFVAADHVRPSMPSSPSKRSSLNDGSRPSLPSSPSKRASLVVDQAGGYQPVAMLPTRQPFRPTTRSVEDKKALVSQHLGNVDALCQAFSDAAVALRV